MKTLEQIQTEVGQWAQANFGDNESPHFVLKMEPFPEGWEPGHRMPNTLVALESLCPLMGIVEEIGELAAATDRGKTEDAIGDIFIYVCDYVSRAGFALPIQEAADIQYNDQFNNINTDPFKGLVAWSGRLCHGTLKRHEGIRGFDDDTKYREHCVSCVAAILAHLDSYAFAFGLDLQAIANMVWAHVSQRDWKAAPVDGRVGNGETV